MPASLRLSRTRPSSKSAEWALAGDAVMGAPLDDSRREMFNLLSIHELFLAGVNQSGADPNGGTPRRGQSADCNVGCSSRRGARLSRVTDLAISGPTLSGRPLKDQFFSGLAIVS